MNSRIRRPLDCITVELGRKLPSSLMGLTPVKSSAAVLNAARIEQAKVLGRDTVVVTTWGDGTPILHTGAPVVELRGKTIRLGDVIEQAKQQGVEPNCRLVKNSNDQTYKLQMWMTPAREDADYIDASLYLRNLVSDAEHMPILGVWINPDTAVEGRNWVNIVVGAKEAKGENTPTEDELAIYFEEKWDQMAMATEYRPKTSSFGQKQRVGAAGATVQTQRDEETERQAKKPRRHYRHPRGK